MFNDLRIELVMVPLERNEKKRISVNFFSSEDTCSMVDKFSSLENPVVVLWFIGTRGLKLECLEYYKNKIIDPIIEKQPSASFVLTDLSAWGAFRDSNISIKTSSHLADFINEKFFPRFRCFKSSDFFENLSTIENEKLIQILKTSVSRIFSTCCNFGVPAVGFRTGFILPENCLVFEDWLDCDASMAYSPLQYLEAMFIIESIINFSNRASNLTVVFALPNDELKYYLTADNSFESDLNFFLKERINCEQLPDSIDIHFRSFNYGMKKSHRPYNYPGTVFKLKNIKEREGFL